jgi:RNA polymerase sigma-70 factor, ECF subfamily
LLLTAISMLEQFVKDSKEPIKHFTDEELVDAYRAEGRHEYLDLVLGRHYKPLLAFINKQYARNFVQAEDIVQETCLKVYLSLATFDSKRRFKPWLYKIAINTALSYLKNPCSVNIEECFSLAVGGDSPEAYVDKKILQEKLQSAIAQLRPDCRELINLFYKEDSNCEEISHRLGVRSAVVKHRLQEARKDLLTNFEL